MTPPGSAGLPPALAARYRFRQQLGEGGFGAVLLCDDLELGRAVAIKVLRQTLGDLEIRKRFEREARLTSQLEHPHIVRVFDFGVAAGDQAYIVYEYVTGGSLADLREQSGPLGAGEIREWGAQVADALAAAHAVGVLHRDVKPENILLREDGQAVLCDFGIARTAVDERTFHTREGFVLGTPSYMAPELFKGMPPDPSSDQFALGATLWELAHGEPVYGTRVLTEILAGLAAGRDPGAPTGAGVGDRDLTAALRRSVRRDPAQRWPDLVALRRALAGERPAAREADTVLIERPPEPPQPTRRGLPVLGLLLVLGTTGFFLSPGAAPPSDPAPAPPPSPSRESPTVDRTATVLIEAGKRLQETHDGFDLMKDEHYGKPEQRTHTVRVIDGLLSPEFEDAFRGYHEVLADYVVAQVVAGEDLRSRKSRAPYRLTLMRLLRHIREDLNRSRGLFQDRALLGGARDFLEMRRREERRDAVRAVPSAAARRIWEASPNLSGELLAMISWVAIDSQWDDAGPILEAMHRRLQEVEPAGLGYGRGGLPSMEIHLAEYLTKRGQLDCDTWREMVRETGARMVDVKDELEPMYLVDILLHQMAFQVDPRFECRKDVVHSGLSGMENFMGAASVAMAANNKATSRLFREFLKNVEEFRGTLVSPKLDAQLEEIAALRGKLEALVEIRNEMER